MSIAKVRLSADVVVSVVEGDVRRVGGHVHRTGVMFGEGPNRSLRKQVGVVVAGGVWCRQGEARLGVGEVRWVVGRVVT
jgi:hypothetical protein